MKWCAPTVLLCAALAGCAAGADRPARSELPAAVLAAPERYIVVAVADPQRAPPSRAGSTPGSYGGSAGYLASSGARTDMERVAHEHGIRLVAAWPIASLKMYCAVFELPEAAEATAVLSELAADRRVTLAQPLQAFHTSSAPAYNDPYVGLQRGFATVDAAGAQQWSRGAGVRVAVIDTGIDLAHPDLRGRVQVARDFVSTDATRFSADRHGTEIAGVIAAQANNHVGIVGIAPDAEIISLKACWETTPGSDRAECNSFTLAEALSSALELGANVVNLSLVGPADPLLTLLVRQGLRHGVVFVGAMPPVGEAAGFPAGIEGVLAVDRAERKAPDTGALRAPGDDILTLTAGGRYDFVSGSSVAAAHVSGAVALLLSRDRHLTPGRIRALLSPVDVAAAGEDTSINACDALAALLDQPRCPASDAMPQGRGAVAAELSYPH